MNNLPRQKLCEIIKLYGKDTCNDYKRIRGLLNDFCGGSYPEINFLLTALEEQVCAELITSSKIVSYEMLSARLVKRLYTNRGMVEEIARWSVDSWALALGITLNESLYAPPQILHSTPQLKAANVAINRAYVSSQQTIVVAPNGGQYTNISEAIQIASPDTLILVKPGIYYEGLVINKRIKVRGDGPKEHIIVESKYSSCIYMQTDDEVLVQGLTLYCHTAQTSNKYHAVNISMGRLKLTECNITSDTLACIYVQGHSASSEIQRCQLHNANGSGIFLENNARGTIEDCDISGNSYPNVSVMHYASVSMRRCKIYDGKSHGILISRNGRGTIEDCDIFHNAYDGVKTKDGGIAIVSDCYIYTNAKQEMWVYQNGMRNIAFPRPPQTSGTRRKTSIPQAYSEPFPSNIKYAPESVSSISKTVNQPEKKPNLIDLFLRSIRVHKEK